jgi:hypothetical protein
MQMTDVEWSRTACNLLKAELARSGVGYKELVSRLDAIGVRESYKGLAAKINRGTVDLHGILTHDLH